MVRALLQDPRVDPAAGDNYAIRNAARRGHTEAVRVLLQDPRVDPAAANNEAIRHAVLYEHAEVVRVLRKFDTTKKIKQK